MKTILKNYSFVTATKVITLTDVATVRLDRLALITDVTTNKILYNFADLSIATATVSTNTITLSALQGGESGTDKLRIDYDVDTADTAFGDSVNAAKLIAGTAVIGHVIADTGSTTAVTGTVTTAGEKTNNNAVPGATNVGVLPGLANAAVQTWTEGNSVLESMDLSGNERVTLGTAIAAAIDSITTYPFGHSYTHISTSTTTVVKSGAGVLHNISINTLGTVASTTTIYDNTAGSGTVIGVINSLTLSGAFILDIAFSTGLTIVTTGTVAPDVTVSYR